MKVAVYLRVSTERCRCRHGHRRHGANGCELCDCGGFELEQSEACQEPDCLQLCKARGWEPLVFREHESGAKVRPIWKQVMEAARVGKVGGVVVWALDRIGRTRVDVAHDLSELFRFGVEVASVKDSWLDQAKGPLRDLLVQIMSWVAEGERAKLIERTKAGQQRARDAGKRIGRPGLSDKTVTKLREWWAGGAMVAVAAAAADLPPSTVRTYYRRFESEAAKNGSENGGPKPQKTKGSDHGKS